MNRHALGLVFPILIAAGSIAMDDAQAADTNEKETANATALEALEDRPTRLEGTIAGIVYAALFDPCLVSVHDDEFSILCSVSPPLSDPQFVRRCFESAAINMQFNRAPDGSGNVFILKDAGSWGATHPVEAVNDVRFSMVHGQSGEAFLTDRK